MPFYWDKISPKKTFGGLTSSRKLSGETDLIFTGLKFSSVWRHKKFSGAATGHFSGTDSFRDF